MPQETVREELLRALAGEAEAADARPHAANGAGQAGRTFTYHGEVYSRLKMEQYLRDRGQDFKLKDAKGARGQTIWRLKQCPFDAAHGHPDSCVMQETDGKPGFKCLHNSCKGNGWQELKAKIGSPEPHHYDPPLAGRDGKKSGGGRGERGPAAASRLVVYAIALLDLFHDSEGLAYASTKARPRQTWPLRSKASRQFLARTCWEQENAAPSAETLQSALAVLEGQALFSGPEQPVYRRLAGHGGRIYLDLGTPDWSAVEVRPGGWQVISEPPVRFIRPKGLLALPKPVKGGRLDELRPFVNVGQGDAGDARWRLLVGWQLGSMRPTGPYPVLCVHGEMGSAKSTTARVLRGLSDPNKTPLRSAPREERDLAIAASNGWLVALDNLSKVPDWLSDALCRLATGGGFATRELYTDADEVLFDYQRPALLTGIEDLATRGDLLDRSLVVHLPAIGDDRRRTEGTFWADFEAARPRILGALLDAVACGLEKLPTTKLDRLPRMADFALWVSACESALGWEPGSFLTTYRAQLNETNETALESSLIYAPLQRLLADQGGSWKGTASALLKELERIAIESITKRQGWPSLPHVLSGHLRRLAPSLRRVGVQVEFEREAGGKGKGKRSRIISITTDPNVSAKERPPASPASPRSPEGDAGPTKGDAQGDARTAKGTLGDAGDAPKQDLSDGEDAEVI